MTGRSEDGVSGPWTPAGNAVWALVWLALAAHSQLETTASSPLDHFDEPVRVGARWIDRERAAAPGGFDPARPGQDPAWQVAAEVTDYAWSRLGPGAAHRAAVRRALLMAEDGATEQALEAAPDPASRAQIARLYGTGADQSGRSPPAPAPPDAAAAGSHGDDALDAALSVEPGGWLSTRVRWRLAGQPVQTVEGERPAADAAPPGAGDRATDETPTGWRAVERARLVVLALGAFAWLGSRRVRRTLGPVRGGAPPRRLDPPPSFSTALGVWLRGDACVQALWLVGSQLSWRLLDADAARTVSIAVPWLAPLPLLWLAQRHCWRPPAGRHPLALAPADVLPFLAMGAAALAVDVLATDWIMDGAWWAGLESHWSEGIDEVLIFGSPLERAVRAADYLLWTPLVEEVGFRGVLYLGLRRRLPAGAAGALSAALFAGLHFYTVPGFLATWVSGLVWAWCFERSGSLWPSIVAHLGYNGLWLVGLEATLG